MSSRDIYYIHISVHDNGETNVLFNTLVFSNVMINTRLKVIYNQWHTGTYKLRRLAYNNAYHYDGIVCLSSYFPQSLFKWDIMILDEKGSVLPYIRNIKNNFIGCVNIYIELL